MTLEKRLYLDFLAVLAFALFVGASTCGTCQARAEKTPPTLADRLYAILLTVHVAPPPEGVTETSEELHERLHEIAEDAAWAAKGNATDALLVLGVDEHESGFAIDTDKGPCRPGTCDGGRAYCSMQIWAKDAAAGQKLFDDRRACFSYGLELLHDSQSACLGMGKDLAFSQYAGGVCSSKAGQEGSKQLYDYWGRWQKRYAAELAAEKKKR